MPKNVKKTDALIEKNSGLEKIDIFDALESGESSELYDVIKQLMTGNADLDLKTEISKPRPLAFLNVIIDFCNNNNLKQSANILESFRNHYLRYMVSYQRSGRKELVEILKERKKELESKEEIVE